MGDGNRKTISLAMIVKNEERNLHNLLKSVDECFDEIIVVDTGSTDSTVKIAESFGCKVFHFDWINDFSKARNFAFSKAWSDFVMWMDGDDVLSDKEAFINWRDTAMEFNGAWYATYHYALDKDGKPIISFVRERVFKRSLNPTWRYPLHEGVVVQPEWQPNYATTWAINHMRTMEDIKADKSRNISILEAMTDKDTRMKFYYGKELYESQRPEDAVKAFDEALKCPDIQPHDRILALQYGAYAAAHCFDRIKDEYKADKEKYFKKATDFCVEGIKADPNRAEFHVAMGDLYLRNKELHKALPCYHAARGCLRAQNSAYEGAVYSFSDCYGQHPTLQIAKVYAHIGMLKEAKEEALKCFEKYGNEEAKNIATFVDEMLLKTNIDGDLEETDDIVFTCPPQQAYPFDEELYKSRGMGGSETALIQMARHLKQKTGKRVIVFNSRESDLTSESGVEWISNQKLSEYMSKKKPRVHIAWRHNIRLTHAPTYLWCHDLSTRGVESSQNFDKILCLSEFHRGYVSGLQGVSREKIQLTRNGLVSEKFSFERKEKNPNKIVWMSSPDRGLERCIDIMDVVRVSKPEAELHVYYGLENLYKYGMGTLADRLKALMSTRPWIKYHGFTEQSKMYHEVSDAAIWLHPCNFIETFCITALEMLSLKIYPITRRLGALANTLEIAEKTGQAILFNHDGETMNDKSDYAAAVRKVMDEKLWETIDFDPKAHDWSRVADEWIDFMGLSL